MMMMTPVIYTDNDEDDENSNLLKCKFYTDNDEVDKSW